MTQRPFFWDPHDSSQKDSDGSQRKLGRAQTIATDDTRVQSKTVSDGRAQSIAMSDARARNRAESDSRARNRAESDSRARNRAESDSRAQNINERRPANSATATHHASSFTSSHSSSPSPSASINLYTGSLRNMLGRAAAPTRPANIRRVDARRSSDFAEAGDSRGSQSMRPSVGDNGALHSTTNAAATATANKDARCEQIVQNFYSKAAQVIAHLRGHRHGMERASRHGIERASSYQPDAAAYTSSQLYASSTSSSAVDIGSGGRRINRWFNLNLEDIAGIKEEARLWRHAAHGPPPMFISVYLDVSGVQGEELQVTDVFGRAWTVDLDAGACRARAVVLESWRLDLAAADACAADLPRVYKQAIVFFRSLYAFAGLLPSTGLARRLADGVLGMYVALHAEPAKGADVIGLDVGLTGTEQFLESHELAPVATPMGTFTMSVQYRRECAFACAPLAGAHEPGDSVQGLDTYFTPTLSSRSGEHFAQQQLSQQQQQQRRRGPHLASPHLASPHLASPHSALAMPSINPFRARPLSMGDSASLPSYLGAPSAAQPDTASRSSLLLRRTPAASNAPATSDTRVRPHSLEQRPRLGSSAAGDSGSILHRSVMLRRFGDALSPTEPPRHDVFGRSPPKMGSVRSVSSGGSAGSVAGRSGLGVAPFKSPSLFEAPALAAGPPVFAAGPPACAAGLHEDPASRRRGLTVGPDAPRAAGSPSSFGTSGSGHSRRLSSSFGNRRASLRRVPDAGVSRRHTIVEDRVWPGRRAGADSSEDIDEFIRMVDAKQPLRAYSQRPSHGSTLQRYHGLLDEFNGLSRDMEGSVVLSEAREYAEGRGAPTSTHEYEGRVLTRTPEDIEPDGELAGSPFRRVAMPNPLRSSSDRVAAAGAKPAAETVDLLQQAFDGLSIEPVLSPRRPHVRRAAPDPERPLPRPVSIPPPGPASIPPGPVRRPHADDAPARQPPVVRGKSQPVSHALGVGRVPTPQPISYSRAHLPGPVPVLPALPALQPRMSPEPGPFSYRSDFAAGGSQLNALLSVADDSAGIMRTPRSTPSTPSQPASTLFTRGAPSQQPQQQQQQQRSQLQRRQENDQLRSNFPPLSFILPRARVVRDTSSTSSRSAAENDQDEDLMFQMDSSMH